MVDLDFRTGHYKWAAMPMDEEGYTHKVLTLDAEGNVIVFARTTSREAAEIICKEYNRENYDSGRR